MRSVLAGVALLAGAIDASRGAAQAPPGADRPKARVIDSTVITAARREERLADAVIATELIGPREISRSGARDLGALLEQHVGVQPEGGVAAGVGVTLQGFGAQRVLILLDGQPVVGRVGGNLDITRLPISLIERIEVVKGPQSTLYGSDAMGGVVNLVTRGARDAGPAAGLAATIGSAGRREGDAFASARLGDWRMRLDGGANVVALAPGVAGDAGTRARRVHVAPRVAFDPAGPWSATLTALAVDESQRYRSGQLYNFSDNSQVNARIAAEWHRGTQQLAPTLSWSRYEHLSRRATTPRPASDSGAVDLQQLVQLEVPFSVVLRASVVDGGLALRRESIEAERVPGGERALHSAEPYAQLTWGRGSLTSTTGARVSFHERWGSFIAPRIAVLWRPRESLGVRVAAGAGYRAPDFKELYLSFANTAAGYAVEGNPSLTPERSRNVSATVSVTGRRSSLRVGGHHTAYRDFIETGAPDASGTYTYANLARGTTAGVEGEGTITVGSARLDLTYTWLHTRDDATGGPLLGRAPYVAALGVHAPAFGVDWSVRLRHTGRTAISREASTDVLVYRAPFTRVDATLVAPIRDGVTLRAGGTNLLDIPVEGAWPGFTGRQLHLGLGAEIGERP